MLSPDTLIPIYRRVQSRKVKALAFRALRSTGLRHLVIRMDTINLCNLRCKMCYYSLDYKRKKEQMDLPLFRKIAGRGIPKDSVPLSELRDRAADEQSNSRISCG